MSRHAEIKAKARRAVHAAFAYGAVYKDGSLDSPVAVTVRWHNKIVLRGDYQDGGYADVIEGIERVIFNTEELAEAVTLVDGVEVVGLTPRNNGVVTLTAPGFEGTTLILGALDPEVGPIEMKWMVTRGDL